MCSIRITSATFISSFSLFVHLVRNLFIYLFFFSAGVIGSTRPKRFPRDAFLSRLLELGAELVHNSWRERMAGSVSSGGVRKRGRPRKNPLPSTSLIPSIQKQIDGIYELISTHATRLGHRRCTHAFLESSICIG